MAARTIASLNTAHIDTRHTHPVIMGKFLFTVPVYAHSGLGIINFEGNDYLGVGRVAGLEGLEESTAIVPTAVTVQLDGLSSDFFDEALNSANYGDKVTLYLGYRNDDGTLIDEPWILYRGRVESPRLRRGAENTISFTIQHELAVLKKTIGTKFSDEEQQRRYPGDTAFARIEQMSTVELIWGRADQTTSDNGKDWGR